MPRNARYVVILRMGFIPEPFALYENGTLIPSHMEVTSVGVYGLYEVIPEAHFASNSQIRVESGDAVVAEFSVGDQIDSSPPTFDSIDIESNRGPVGTCERMNVHQVMVNGLGGEYAPERAWAVLEPTDPSQSGVMAGLFGLADLAVLASEVCPSDDETLWDEFHRSYVLTVVDAAGNRSEPLEFTTKGKGRTVSPDGEVLSTRRCSTASVESTISHLLLGALALAFRRRRCSGSR